MDILWWEQEKAIGHLDAATNWAGGNLPCCTGSNLNSGLVRFHWEAGNIKPGGLRPPVALVVANLDSDRVHLIAPTVNGQADVEVSDAVIAAGDVAVHHRRGIPSQDAGDLAADDRAIVDGDSLRIVGLDGGPGYPELTVRNLAWHARMEHYPFAGGVAVDEAQIFDDMNSADRRMDTALEQRVGKTPGDQRAGLANEGNMDVWGFECDGTSGSVGPVREKNRSTIGRSRPIYRLLNRIGVIGASISSGAERLDTRDVGRASLCCGRRHRQCRCTSAQGASPQ